MAERQVTEEEVAKMWAKMRARWRVFAPPQPLCLGIYHQLVCALHPSLCGFHNTDYTHHGRVLKVVLARHCDSPTYLQQCIEGTPRVGLDGVVCGEVTGQEASYAALRLQQVQARVTVAAATKNVIA